MRKTARVTLSAGPCINLVGPPRFRVTLSPRHSQLCTATAAATRPTKEERDWNNARLGQASGRQTVPQKFWQDKNNVIKALERAEATLGITKAEDWYSVNLADLRYIGFPSAMNRTKLAELLMERYPEHKWESVFLLRGKLAQQKRLEKAVISLFPGHEIKANVRKEAALVNPESFLPLELDIYIPSLNLAFEYQEAHHYKSAGYTYQPIEHYIKRDMFKRELAAAKGITLLVIPFWWDGRRESLVATIRKERPDLLTEALTEDAEPIAPEMPPGYSEVVAPSVQGIGQPTNACFFTMSNINPAQWWVFEKYDGVRGFWNPEEKAFYSRLGNRFSFPPEIVDTMPTDTFLDGEIWFGRDNFSEAMKISNRARASLVDWSKFKYMVFDLPKHPGTYEERYTELAKQFGNSPSKYMEVAPCVECKDMNHLEQIFQDIIDKGGEGVILRDPTCPLQPGRSPGYLKHKKFRDAEAMIVKYVEPFQWECELPNGVRFIAPAGTNEFSKRWKPAPGDIVSFKHHGFLMATKKPKLPSLYRLRPDLKWEDVVRNYKEQKFQPAALPMRRPVKQRPKGYWHNIDNRRQFFEEFAQKMGFDPLNVDSWNNVTIIQVMANMDSIGPLTIYKNSLRLALQATYPELPFQFKEKKPNGYWADVENRRQFFMDYAAERGFDPLVVDNWKNVSKAQILARHSSVPFPLFSGSLPKTLSETFPELDWSGISRAHPVLPKGYWDDEANTKAFFLEFARKMGFDPYDAENWHRVTRAQILAHKGSGPLSRYDWSLASALTKTFPELKFNFEAHPDTKQRLPPRKGYMPWIRNFFG